MHTTGGLCPLCEPKHARTPHSLSCRLDPFPPLLFLFSARSRRPGDAGELLRRGQCVLPRRPGRRGAAADCDQRHCTTRECWRAGSCRSWETGSPPPPPLIAPGSLTPSPSFLRAVCGRPHCAARCLHGRPAGEAYAKPDRCFPDGREQRQAGACCVVVGGASEEQSRVRPPLLPFPRPLTSTNVIRVSIECLRHRDYKDIFSTEASNQQEDGLELPRAHLAPSFSSRSCLTYHHLRRRAASARSSC
jgi:hypothetical protein